MSDTLDRDRFESIYAKKPPCDIGRPQRAFVEVADRVTGAILDAGCGTGENAPRTRRIRDRHRDVLSCPFGFVRTKLGESLSALMQARQIIVPDVPADSSRLPVPEVVLH